MKQQSRPAASERLCNLLLGESLAKNDETNVHNFMIMTALKVDFYNNTLRSDYYASLPACDFRDFACNYVMRYKKRCSDFAGYRSLLKHLDNFATETGERLASSDLGVELVGQFIEYLHVDQQLTKGTVQGLIIKLKFLLSKAYKNGWNVDQSYSDAKVRTEDLFFIYLDERDISRIYYFDRLTKPQEEVRDLFIIGCKTGLRYSDYSRLSPENIKGDMLQIKTQKTRMNVCVPLSNYVKEILQKYDYHIPTPRCIQYFNKAIKVICKKVGMTEIITFEREIAGEIVMISKPKYELISSHTARRTFATNMIKDGTAESNIMKLTGHKSSQCFARYNRMTIEENARALSGTGFLS